MTSEEEQKLRREQENMLCGISFTRLDRDPIDLITETCLKEELLQIFHKLGVVQVTWSVHTANADIKYGKLKSIKQTEVRP